MHGLGPMSVVSVADFNTAIKMFVHDGSSYEERAPFKKFNQMTRGGLYGNSYLDSLYNF
jgi:hypothetical protein